MFKQEIWQENRYFSKNFYFSKAVKIMYFLMLPNSLGNVQNFEHHFSIDCEIWRVEFGGAVQLSAPGEGDLLPFSHVSGHVRCCEVREQACSVTGVYLISISDICIYLYFQSLSKSSAHHSLMRKMGISTNKMKQLKSLSTVVVRWITEIVLLS